MSALRLALRSSSGLLFDGPVEAISAEDQSGWFGVLPGREDLIAVLPPGLLMFRDEQGEAFVALAGGLLDLRRERCRVLARDALVERSLDEVAGRVETLLTLRRQAGARRRSVVDDLAKEAMRRLALEVRT
ncbi:MAG: F0F1 ATP synthase subunit epsilon [Polyangiaceae bacterium]|nr:F0F1 ATP synthase subunit epsilon [Polyangiaceae bacterium]MBK8941318.1 F0F1 ATP synthase subunit epsilon [Polyangiaceae bacterium]